MDIYHISLLLSCVSMSTSTTLTLVQLDSSIINFEME